jgi:hypothetical protein
MPLPVQQNYRKTALPYKQAGPLQFCPARQALGVFPFSPSRSLDTGQIEIGFPSPPPSPSPAVIVASRSRPPSPAASIAVVLKVAPASPSSSRSTAGDSRSRRPRPHRPQASAGVVLHKVAPPPYSPFSACHNSLRR